jgi:molybdopterin-guanine dinucleotide biosynthesis protein A
MGRDKASIQLEGIPLLRRVCEAARSCANPVYVVTFSPERYRDILPENCQIVREVHLPGETEPHGPLVGFARGLVVVEADWVLLLACDMPQLKAEVLQQWAKGLEKVPKEAIALLPKQAKGWEPLCGFYRRQCLSLLTEFIDQGGRSFQRWLAQHPVQELPVSDRNMLFNCNTPTDLEGLKLQN